jgi:signal transduction histidine kinase
MLTRKLMVWIKQAIVLPLAFSLAAILIVTNEFTFQNSLAALHDADLAQVNRAGLNTLLQNILDAETGQRGYLLTGDPSYLEPFSRSMSKMNETLGVLQKHYLTPPESAVKFMDLSQSISKKISELELTIRLRQSTTIDAQWRTIVEAGLGKEYMNEIHNKTLNLIDEATKERDSGMTKAKASLQISRISIVITALLGLLAFYYYLRQTKRISSLVSFQKDWLIKENIRLEKIVDERTLSLTELATYLQTIQEKEREHLARELHDELGSLLTAAKFDVARVKSKIAPTGELHDRLQHLTNTLNAGIALKRRIIENLHPSSLSKLGLAPALKILVREFQQRTGITVTSNFEEMELAENQELTIYRVVQESLTNAAKHAAATEITISLQKYANHIELTITDNGRGFDATVRSNSGHGLLGMRHRVNALHGKLEITSSVEAGTRIYVELTQSV